MKTFSGQVVSKGYAKGKIHVLRKHQLVFSGKRSNNPDLELKLFVGAIEKAKLDLEKLRNTALTNNHSESAEVLEAHLMLLADPEVDEKTRELILAGKSAEESYFSVIEEFKDMFLNLKDDYMKQRALDLQDICQRVMFYIQTPNEVYPDLNLQYPSIVVAYDLVPSQILSMNMKYLKGLVTVQGGGTSHTAILARSLEIPCLSAVNDEILSLHSGNEVLLDAEKGRFFINFDKAHETQFDQSYVDYKSKIQSVEKLRGQKSVTIDGHEITLAANISGPQDLPSFKNNDAEAVGLYRTEFLFLDRKTAPSEEEQYKVYKEVFSGLNGKKIYIRTLDIGGDKKVDYLHIKPEENPFLGVRAIRLCFQRPDIFKSQLRALLRAGVDANWGLMFPMISQLEELLKAKSFIDEVKLELKNEGIKYSDKFEVGIMIEIPSVAWMIDVFAGHVDFVSLGTNDLLQYTCAADRLNPDLRDIYNPFNVGFLRQIHHAIKTCCDKNIHTGICGSLSHHELLMPFFIGCGVHELSMTSQHILPTREKLRKLNQERCRALVQGVLHCRTSEEIKEICKNL